ncbi:Nucleic acid-binding OB-fold-like protein [Klebsormidium nitens]|uniref:Nucleic acid-binding OB-fold-like protein n=1 Tax=Klebsormidium nitens TaxID=105231 RepID=A0A1Y1IB95_KLENI|nr:Nucleic acid-binding OB-fold-like protein [Klebsormidium nitens]|eukprot:GAQ85976.1 Nucleic acid-binding OB-fold-like protein [Klebsormidium nitens]
MAPGNPASGIVLHLDDSASSKTVLLVSNVVRWVSEVVVEVQNDSKAGPIAQTVDGEVSGAGTISRYLARAGGDVCFGRLFGETPEAQAGVAQWLTNSNTILTSPTGVTPASRLAALNVYLQPRAVLFGSGTTISVADIAAFSSVHKAVVALSPEDQASLPHLLRWFDYIQHAGDISGVYTKIPIKKPSFNPPALAAPAPKPAKPTEAESSASPPPKTPAASQATSETSKPSAGGKKEPADTSSKAAAEAKAGEGKADDSKEKKAKKEKPPAVKKEVDVSISALDIRIGVITKVAKHPNADALYVEDIDLGEGPPRQVVSGLAKFLTEEQMHGRKVVVLANVKPGKVRDVMSSGLVLCASNEDHTQCEPIVPPAGAEVGSKVTFPGYDGEPEPVLNPKKKQLEKILPDLKTDKDGVAKFQAVPFTTSLGPCTSSLKDAIIK